MNACGSRPRTSSTTSNFGRSHAAATPKIAQPDAELQRRALPVFPQLVLWALRDARTIRRFYAHLRKLEVSAAQRAQILACQDEVQLDRWLHSAVNAGSAVELFLQ